MIEEFLEKGARLLGTKYPILAKSFPWASSPQYVSTLAQEGVFGVLFARDVPAEILYDEIYFCDIKSPQAFGIELHPFSPFFAEHLRMILESPVSTVLLFGPLVSEQTIQHLKDTGKKVFVYVFSPHDIHIALSLGADALILRGNESGGFVGSASLQTLVQEICSYSVLDIPFIVSGGISSFPFMVYLFQMGVSAIEIGGPFLVTQESPLSPKVKESILEVNSLDSKLLPTYLSQSCLSFFRGFGLEALEEFETTSLQLREMWQKKEISLLEMSDIIFQFFWRKIELALRKGIPSKGILPIHIYSRFMSEIVSTSSFLEQFFSELQSAIDTSIKFYLRK